MRAFLRRFCARLRCFQRSIASSAIRLTSFGYSIPCAAAAVANSLCFGIYTAAGEQVGLVRVISDYATFAYLCDVYVLETHRGRGLSKAAMAFVTAHPRLQGLQLIKHCTRQSARLRWSGRCTCS